MELKENERIDDLQYKGLKLIQNKEGFCFGVDSVLLSDYAKNIKKDTTVLDIGTGTGIVELNNLQNKMEIINVDVKEIFNTFQKGSFDAIVTNPPYKKINTGVKNIKKEQLISRHEVECTLEDIIEKSSKLLKSLGEFYMVHRAERLVDIMCLLRKYKLEPKNIRFVHSKANEKPTLFKNR